MTRHACIDINTTVGHFGHHVKYSNNFIMTDSAAKFCKLHRVIWHNLLQVPQISLDKT